MLDRGIMSHIHALQVPFYILYCVCIQSMLYKDCLPFYNILFINLAYAAMCFNKRTY